MRLRIYHDSSANEMWIEQTAVYNVTLMADHADPTAATASRLVKRFRSPSLSFSNPTTSHPSFRYVQPNPAPVQAFPSTPPPENPEVQLGQPVLTATIVYYTTADTDSRLLADVSYTIHEDDDHPSLFPESTLEDFTRQLTQAVQTLSVPLLSTTDSKSEDAEIPLPPAYRLHLANSATSSKLVRDPNGDVVAKKDLIQHDDGANHSIVRDATFGTLSQLPSDATFTVNTPSGVTTIVSTFLLSPIQMTFAIMPTAESAIFSEHAAFIRGFVAQHVPGYYIPTAERIHSSKPHGYVRYTSDRFPNIVLTFEKYSNNVFYMRMSDFLTIVTGVTISPSPPVYTASSGIRT
jgi:hypothetical protein